MVANVFRLGDVSEIELQNFNFVLKFSLKNEINYIKKPAILTK